MNDRDGNVTWYIVAVILYLTILYLPHFVTLSLEVIFSCIQAVVAQFTAQSDSCYADPGSTMHQSATSNNSIVTKHNGSDLVIHW